MPTGTPDTERVIFHQTNFGDCVACRRLSDARPFTAHGLARRLSRSLRRTPQGGTLSVQVTVQTNPAGLAFSVDGTTYSSTQTFSRASGSSHTIATTSPQSGGTGIRYVWTRWSDNSAISHTVTPTTNKTYTATFKKQYYLTMTHGTGGTVSPGSGWRDSGVTVSITATPSTGYSFSNWAGTGTGSYSGTTNPGSITMGGPITEAATFTQ